MSETVLSIGNFLVLLITGVIVFFYTKATYELKNISEEQKELSLLPLLAVYFRGAGTERKFRIRNLGNGTALNIKISNTKWSLRSGELELKLSLKDTNVLASKEERDLESKVFKNGKQQNSLSMLAHFDPEFANRNYRLKIAFQNSLGARYTTTIHTGKDGIFVLKPPKRLKN